jgi:putative ABC transport system permease protein
MKFIDIFTMASSNMFRSKLRTTLTIIAIFVGSFTITMTVGISSGISNYIDKQLNSLGGKDALFVWATVDKAKSSDKPVKYNPDSESSTVSTSTAESLMLKPSDLSKIRQQDGIISVDPMLTAKPSYIQGINGEKYETTVSETIKGVTMDLVTGNQLDSNKNEILLPVNYVESLGFSSANDALGKTVTFGINNGIYPGIVTIYAVVVGVQQKNIISVAGTIVSAPLMNDLYNAQTNGLSASVKNQYVAAVARVDKNVSSDKLAKIKSSLLKKGYTATTIEDQIGVIKQVIDAITDVLIFFGAISLLAASFGIINTLFMSVQERTKEIGLMKAMGMSKGKIFLLFSVEAILIGVLGSLLGVLAAMGIGEIANPIASNGFLKGLPGFNLTVFPILDISIVILVIATIAFLAGTLPAKRAANLDPIKALRYE